MSDSIRFPIDLSSMTMGAARDANSATSSTTSSAPAVAPTAPFAAMPAVDHYAENTSLTFGGETQHGDVTDAQNQVDAITKELADAQSRLDRHYFDSRGNKVYTLPEGSAERLAWQGKVDQLNRSAGLLHTQASRSIPAASAQRVARDSSLEAQAARMQEVFNLSNEVNPATGRPYGMVEAAKVIDARRVK